MARPSTTYLCLLGLELAIATATTTLFGLAYPDRFRSRLWENGGEEGWNSNPNKRIYFYANHREPPEIPLIWSQRLTDSNLGIAILSLFIFFARAVMTHLNYLPSLVSILYDILLASLWTASVVGQSSEDCSDPEHPSLHPWYLTHSCSESWASNRGYCRVAQASFVFSVLATGLYIGRLVRAALLFAYRRGKYQGRKWTAIDVEGHMDGDEEEKYYDEERSLTPKVDMFDQALSPVLAFFPSGPDHFRM